MPVLVDGFCLCTYRVRTTPSPLAVPCLLFTSYLCIFPPATEGATSAVAAAAAAVDKAEAIVSISIALRFDVIFLLPSLSSLSPPSSSFPIPLKAVLRLISAGQTSRTK